MQKCFSFEATSNLFFGYLKLQNLAIFLTVLVALSYNPTKLLQALQGF